MLRQTSFLIKCEKSWELWEMRTDGARRGLSKATELTALPFYSLYMYQEFVGRLWLNSQWGSCAERGRYRQLNMVSEAHNNTVSNFFKDHCHYLRISFIPLFVDSFSSTHMISFFENATFIFLIVKRLKINVAGCTHIYPRSRISHLSKNTTNLFASLILILRKTKCRPSS